MIWTERFWVKVNKTDYCWLWTAALDTKGYGQFHLMGKTRQAHRLAYKLAHGEIPRSVFLDHTCFVHHCVNPLHMRPTTTKQNQENREGLTSHNKSGYRGVSMHGCGKWQATVKHAGKVYYLGLFTDPVKASEVAKAKRLELFTHNDKDRSTI